LTKKERDALCKQNPKPLHTEKLKSQPAGPKSQPKVNRATFQALLHNQCHFYIFKTAIHSITFKKENSYK